MSSASSLGRGKSSQIPGVDEMIHGKASLQNTKHNSSSLISHDSPSQTLSSPKRTSTSSPRFSDSMDEQHLGTMRASMKTNYLLVKRHPQTGSVPPPISSPKIDPSMAFGVSNDYSDGGVSAVINGSRDSQSASKKGRSKSTGEPIRLDYVAMNKKAIEHGLVNAKEQFRLRDAVQVEKKIKYGQPRRHSEAPKDGRTYGVPNVLENTLPAILRNDFQREWTEKQLSRSKSEAELKTSVKSGQTRTTMLRQKTLEPERPQSLWKMSKFQNVGPAISTFRDDTSRQRAMESHKSDGVARLGEQQHGIYIQ